jgi:hypothetical protein
METGCAVVCMFHSCNVAKVVRLCNRWAESLDCCLRLLDAYLSTQKKKSSVGLMWITIAIEPLCLVLHRMRIMQIGKEEKWTLLDLR